MCLCLPVVADHASYTITLSERVRTSSIPVNQGFPARYSAAVQRVNVVGPSPSPVFTQFSLTRHLRRLACSLGCAPRRHRLPGHGAVTVTRTIHVCGLDAVDAYLNSGDACNARGRRRPPGYMEPSHNPIKLRIQYHGRRICRRFHAI